MRKCLLSFLLLLGCAKAHRVPVVADPLYRISPTSDENTFLVQVPRGRTINDFLQELGCGEEFVCAIGTDAIYVIRRKMADKPKG